VDVQQLDAVTTPRDVSLPGFFFLVVRKPFLPTRDGELPPMKRPSAKKPLHKREALEPFSQPDPVNPVLVRIVSAKRDQLDIGCFHKRALPTIDDYDRRYQEN
jgi:hypothetical protein